MHVRNRRIARAERRALLRPNTGFSPMLMALEAKRDALATYVAVPISFESQKRRLLASFRSLPDPTWSPVTSAD